MKKKRRRKSLKISSGKKKTYQKVVIYGPEGIGKSTLASQFPQPLVIDTEGSTYHIDVNRFEEKPSSWAMLLSQVKYVLDNPSICKTLVIDTGDWAESLAKDYVSQKNGWTSIAQPGYGQGYVELEKTFGELLNDLTQVLHKGINIVMVAHSQVKTFEQPDEVGSYDRYELKLEKKPSALLKEWADTVIFINYETYITSKNKQGKGTATGGKRVMHFNHAPAWDAKNRWGLDQNSYDLDYSVIAPFIYREEIEEQQETVQETIQSEQKEEPETNIIEENKEDFTFEMKKEPPFEQEKEEINIDPALKQLMEAEGFDLEDILAVIYAKGIYPQGTPYESIDPSFIQGAVIGQWESMKPLIKEIKETGKLQI